MIGRDGRSLEGRLAALEAAEHATAIMTAAAFEAVVGLMAKDFTADKLAKNAAQARAMADQHRANPAPPDAVWAERHIAEILDMTAKAYEEAAAYRRDKFTRGEIGREGA